MIKFRILLIGSGGREHAIARAIKRSKFQSELIVFGTHENPGLLSLAFHYKILDINNPFLITDQIHEIIKSDGKMVDFAIIGPEAPLEKGVSDALWEMHIPVIGPNAEHSQIETSKYFARQLLYQAGLESASPKWIVFSDNDYETEAEDYSAISNHIENVCHNRCVIKADGLHGGKGVKIYDESDDTKNNFND